MTSTEKKSPPQDFFERISPYLEKIWGIIRKFRFIVAIGLLAFLVKVAYTHSMDMWDEGWFTAIASRMASGLSDPFHPLYYPSENEQIQFFDKPPAAFWGGAILMVIFGRTTFAAKGIVIMGGAGLALIVYFLFSHQSENRSAAAIGGLLVALAHFLTFYSRTAYIDSFTTFMAALVMLMGIRAIDAIFIENNLKKGYILLIITTIVNVFNILTKAWQGVLTAPAIAIYLIFRYLERHIHLDDLRAIWRGITTSFSVSPEDMESELIISSQFFKSGVPYPFIIAGISFGSSFIGAYLIDHFVISSIILGVGALISVYIVFLNFSVERKEQLRIPGIVTGVIAGLIAGIAGSFVVKLVFSRFLDPFIAFAQAIGEESSLSFLPDFMSNEILILLILEIVATLFGIILTFGVAFFLAGVILEALTKHREYRFLRVIFESLDFIPLVVLGMWLAIWFVVFLLMGTFFEREANTITFLGIIGSLVLIFIVTLYPNLKNAVSTRLNLKTRLRSVEELAIFRSHLLFLCIAIALIILSFYPFVYWVQFMDANIANGTFPWSIRVPGELSRDPERPNPVTYTFLFYEYYIGWRFTHNTSAGDLAASVGSAINDYALLVMLPFFIVGFVAFFFSNKRNPALGSALLAWLITIPFVFFPAQFQLNYYYIPLTIPYFAIAAKGVEYMYSTDHWRITVTDSVERFLAGGYFYLETGVLLVLLPITNFSFITLDFLAGSITLSNFINQLDFLTENLFIAAIYLVPFTVITFRILKTFPGIIAFSFAYKLFLSTLVKDFGQLYDVLFHDLPDIIFSFDYQWLSNVFEFGAPVLTLIGIILLIFALYWLKPNIKPQGLIILSFLLFAMLIRVSVLAHINQIYDQRFQESATYIVNHGGAYNYSTWVIDATGVKFAMMYYLGYEVVKGSAQKPFSDNTIEAMDQYYQWNPNIKFWIVTNKTKHWEIPPLAINYSVAYKWLTTNEHLVCVDAIVGLTSWLNFHLFVNKTYITETGTDWTKLYG
ncbi:MAG: hypothetical protein ACXAC8_13180 [Candidatus Hodarchaeales archaeon]|jgi:hypothetical protein